MSTIEERILESAMRLRDLPVLHNIKTLRQSWRAKGINPDKAEKIFFTEPRVCYICKRPESVFLPLGIDHDHKTGRIRGVLCIKCNVALGRIGDSVEIIRATLDYLTRDNDTYSNKDYSI